MKAITCHIRVPDIFIVLIQYQAEIFQAKTRGLQQKDEGALTSERLAYFASSAVLFKRRATCRIAKSSKAYLHGTGSMSGYEFGFASAPAYLKCSATFPRSPPCTGGVERIIRHVAIMTISLWRRSVCLCARCRKKNLTYKCWTAGLECSTLLG